MGTNIPTSTLGSTDRTIPLLGYGTAEYPFGASIETMKESILHAIELGYRHFDSASLYQSEVPLGEAISKLWCSDGHKDLVLPALQKTLENLQLEYLDLYLIHWPVSSKPGEYVFPVKEEDLLPMDFQSVWEAMEECQKLGLAKSIGVSNFSCKKLEDLLATAKIPPAVNQVEISPLWQQKKIREFCKEKGIHVTAYSPLGAKGMSWGTNNVMECQVLKEIAAARGKSMAQICLRWVHEQGVSVLVRSFNKERMKQNLDIFDWKLSQEDLKRISQIPQQRAAVVPQFVSEKGPYKSVEEFWDGEI
ncbi:PREDICTED: non-functional NADPH-dependent codeinone reductase 2-like isoform X2 [Populus euphratica]|uniref:Non-functional NADPH-dependent codeinone reductase 2-like isoform X2 n=1 Tax=Populus euphratica TaxID=75702 RepID=A0AAJ6U3G1_POPEU|nr:PREDICTED: non-functional NADPH-dependent codeinone reductase 2-like isoform X2 [Populus euphratica]